MNSNNQNYKVLNGPSGNIEYIINIPALPHPKGIVVIAHPHPLLGGSSQHKVPSFLAKEIVSNGWIAVRPNFRGVGASTGPHDHGNGEKEDLIYLTEKIISDFEGLKLALVGVSFGAFVQAKVAKYFLDKGTVVHKVGLLAMPNGTVQSGRSYAPPQDIPNVLVVHGELDEQIPITNIFEWARPNKNPVCVMTGADHLFTGQLVQLKQQVIDYLNN